jgi:phosphoribosyl 1,2-cyclic phosphodiesterase
MEPWRLQLRFWGVRGSLPTPEAEHLGYGGNTTCLEFMLPTGEAVVLDAGSGIRNLGAALTGRPVIHLFFSHLHWDHLQGLPFFAPLFDPNTALKLYSSRYSGDLKAGLRAQMRRPYFPIDFDEVQLRCEFIELETEAATIGSTTITPFPLYHAPDGASGYRVECGGAVIVHASDREHGNQELDGVFEEWVQNADLLVHDAQYTPEQYREQQGWGHSTWEEAVRVAHKCRVKQLALFHHDPRHDDSAIARIEGEAKKHFDQVFAARERMIVKL